MKLTWLAPAVLFISTTAQAVELSSTIGFTSDYRFHGISQTAGDAAIQGSIDASFDNGLYAGVWGSNVDFGDDANLEIDYYLGYAGNLTEDISYSATALYFQYPGYDTADIDFIELDLTLGWKDINLTYAIANSYLNTGEEGYYLALDYSYALTEKLNLDLHAGHSFGDYWDQFDIGDYQDYSIGLSSNLAGLDLSIAYLFNDVDTSAEVNSGVVRNDSSIVFTLSRTF